MDQEWVIYIGDPSLYDNDIWKDIFFVQSFQF